MAKRDNLGRVDQAIIERMADAVQSEIEADRKLAKTVADVNAKTGTVGAVRRGVQTALMTQAAIVAEAKNAGYSQLVAEAALMQGRARARERRQIAYGDVASTEATPKEIRIKSDGKGAVQLYQNAARNGNVNRQRVTQATVDLKVADASDKRILRDVQKGFTPLEAEHGGWKAADNDSDDGFDWS